MRVLNSVNPTRSANRTVTSGKVSTMVDSPALSRSAMLRGRMFRRRASDFSRASRTSSSNACSVSRSRLRSRLEPMRASRSTGSKGFER